MKRKFLGLLLLALCVPASALGAEKDQVWTVYDTQGAYLTSIGGAVQLEDEYISGDNRHYVVIKTDEAQCTAVARFDGMEPMPQAVLGDWTVQASVFSGNARKIGLYCTHSDESYEPTDGTFSDEVYGGIYDVTDQLKEELEKRNIEVTVDYTSHLPHDAGAYRRSRSTAISLLETGPEAIFDVHRDGVAAEEYETQIDGEEVSKVRLLVGRSNANQEANRDFAKTIKGIADERYPGLVKDIFIGKGDYNQDLSPRCVLLEFGTHENSKELPLHSTQYMAEVISLAVFGDTGEQPQATQGKTAQSDGRAPETTQPPGGTGGTGGAGGSAASRSVGMGKGLMWVLGLAVGGGLLYLLIVKGTARFGHKAARAASEITGGIVGEKPDENEEPPEEKP